VRALLDAVGAKWTFVPAPEVEICDYVQGHFFCILPKGHDEGHGGYLDDECVCEQRLCTCFDEDPENAFGMSTGGGNPAKAHRFIRRRSVREIAMEHGIPIPPREAHQAEIDWLTRKPMDEDAE
jgi:hypothetical protein